MAPLERPLFECHSVTSISVDGASQAGGRDQFLCPGSHQERLALDNEIQPEESDLLWAIQGENLIAINTPLPKIADTEYLALTSGDLELVWSTFFTDPFQILGDL
jgi:hypothetical protein